MTTRETDAAKRTTRFTAVVWAIGTGSILGTAAGAKAAGGVGVLLGVPITVLLIYGITMLIVNTAGRAAMAMANPSGQSTPPRREYSLAQSLAARGRYDEAISAYEVACADYPDDPEPYLRLARLYRDDVRDLEEATLWFKRARAEARITAHQEQLITLELIELFRDKMRAPAKAIPELARLSDRFSNTPIGDNARRELEQLRTRALREAAALERRSTAYPKHDDPEDGQEFVSLRPE